MLRARPFKNTVKARAEQLVAGTGWLPEPLRIAMTTRPRVIRLKP
jgi:hypothetical protein